jgi:hypothetical protein
LWLAKIVSLVLVIINRIEWQCEQVYRMPVQIALFSRVIIDQLTPMLPKVSEEVNAQVKSLHAMLDAATMTDPPFTNEAGGKVRTLTIARAYVGTRPATYRSLWMSVARVRVERTFGMSFIPGKHVTELRTVAKNEITPSATVAMKGTMITMALTMTSLLDVILQLEGIMNGGDQFFLSRFEEGALAAKLQTVRDQDD